MKALIVGAGAVGQVYARHLQLGGAEVGIFVREKYAAEYRRGFALYPLNRSQPRDAAVHLHIPTILTDPTMVAEQRWDQVYLCISSTALRGDWLDALLAALGNATVITLQPGVDDREFLLKRIRDDRLVSGMISLISYHAPLAGESVPEPGMAYWFPPLSPSPFSGPSARVADVVRALNTGGLPAKTATDVTRTVAFPGAALIMLVAALESSAWSFAELARSPVLRLACEATHEARMILERKLGTRSPRTLALLSPTAVRALLFLAPHLVPLDLETYFKAHFTKVGDQTRYMIQTYIDHGRALGFPVQKLETLIAGLAQHPNKMDGARL